MKRVLINCILFSLLSGLDVTAATYYRNALVLAYSPVNSIFEDENILLEIYDGQLWASNKTKKALFIDLSQCFLINNGSSYPLLEKSENENTASRAKLSSAIDEYISISPVIGDSQNPTKIGNMSGPIYRTYLTTESSAKNFSDYDKRFMTLVDELVQESLENDPKKKNYTGTSSRHLLEDESISNIGASIAYSFSKSKSAEDWTNVMISTWVSDVIFTPYQIRLPKKLSKKERKGFGIKENEGEQVYLKADSPFEFNEDKTPLIVVDWDGNYNEGSFTLSSIHMEDPDNKNTGKSYKVHLIFEGPDADWGKLSKVTSFKSYMATLIKKREYVGE